MQALGRLACHSLPPAARRAAAPGAVPSRSASAAAHAEFLQREAKLPRGFRVGSSTFAFRPEELPDSDMAMTLTLLVPDAPVESFAAVFTRNAMVGAPVAIGRQMLQRDAPLAAVVVNNRISNVRSPGGEAAAQQVCAAVAQALQVDAAAVLPSSTGIIGWGIPADEMSAHVPAVVDTLQHDTVLPAARGIMTTDRYPKVRSAAVGGTDGGRVVGVAKGAGMVEPNLATMLCFVMTDVDVPRDALRAMLSRAVDSTFNCISVDSDTSTSDTVLAMSSGVVPCPPDAAANFEAALTTVLQKLAVDVVRNGEGVSHVMRVAVRGAPSDDVARAVGKAVVNSPLFKSAVAGNDPNVGRLVAALGKPLGAAGLDAATLHAVPDKLTLRLGGVDIYTAGRFALDARIEGLLHGHLKHAEMEFEAGADGAVFPPHERVVDIEVDLGGPGSGACVVHGADLTAEYVSINADYRS